MPVYKPIDIAVVIPAFNEAQTIKHIVTQALQFCPNVIVVDDGSTDGTAQQIKELPITLIQNQNNRGKGFSLLVGFIEALAKPVEAIITFDADGQHDPNDIIRLARAASQYPDHFIIGARMRKQEFSPRHRLRANQIADFFISIAARTWVKDTQSGFRLYPAGFLKKLNLNPQKNERFVFESRAIIEASAMGYPIGMVPIDAHYPKNARGSHYNWLSDTLQISWMISSQLLKKGIQVRTLYEMLKKKQILLLEE